MGMISAAIYVRLSKESGENGSLSLETQEAACRAMAEYKGWAVHGVYSDDGVSGATVERPALERMLADAKAGKFSILLVFRIDRLGRSLSGVLELIKRLEAAKVRLAIKDLDLDPTTPLGAAMLQMALVFAELERRMIGERTSLALRARRAQLRPYSKEPVLGFRKKAGRLVPDERELEAVRTILRLRSSGHSLRQIADALEGEDIKTRHGKRRWSPQTLAQVMARREWYATHLEAR